tara:strand:+ start:351 stop:923 length:573 start_codon:yes stop_codon:yes gene_type:complete
MHFQFPKIFCFINAYNKNYIKRLPKNIAIIYRNYNKPTNNHEINYIKKICKKTNKKFFLSNNFKIALKLGLDGVYIPSFNKELKINYFKKKKKFLILGSAHNLKQIREKEKQNVNLIFLSPVFEVKKSKNFLGIHEFNKLSNYTNKKIISLGGLKKNNLNKIKMLNSHGFSSVSLFKQNIKYIRLNEKFF